MTTALANKVDHLINQIAVDLATAVSQRLAQMVKPPIPHPREIPVTPKTEIASKFLTEADVQREYNLSTSWLRKKRLFREAPPFLKIGKMVRYCREDIEKYLADRYCDDTQRATRT
jgi:predicted DNA-binding transcriptional regulator AlpA